ncbi:hypothetical protein D9M68_935640 [compost metagenome]
MGPSRLTGPLALGTLPNSSMGARGELGAAAFWFISASISSWDVSPASARAAAHSSARACSSGVGVSMSFAIA